MAGHQDERERGQQQGYGGFGASGSPPFGQPHPQHWQQQPPWQQQPWPHQPAWQHQPPMPQGPGGHAGWQGGPHYGPPLGGMSQANPYGSMAGGGMGWQGGWQGGDPFIRPEEDDQEHYRHWRQQQISRFDQDYENWRDERRRKFASEFDKWRQARQQQGAQTTGGEPDQEHK